MADLRLSDISSIRAAIDNAQDTVQTLWTNDSVEHDCVEEKVDIDNKIVLQAPNYDKLGSIHCGVTRPGFVAVGGQVSNLDNGHGILFTKTQIVVCRSDDDYVFVRFADL